MSTLSGIASKGEKGKPKFQSLDINNLYRVSRGESLEPHQQKNALPRKTGMQSLGKLPSARRPPANLPSLKSEHSGNDPAISLVPSGGSGWGASKPGETSPAPGTPAAPTTPNATVPATTTVQPPQPAATLSPVTPAAAPAAVAIVTPPTATSPGQVAHGHAHPQIHPHPQPHPHSHPHPHLGGGASSSDKSWSSIMVGGGTGGDPTNVTAPSFLAHQSPLFQQEFPSLSSGDGQGPAVGQKGGSGVVATTPSGPEAQYGPGPSLRPQTGGDLGGGRSNLGPLGPQGAGMVPGGPGSQPNGPSSGGHPGVGPLAGQAGPIGAFRGVMPPFMYRGNFPGPFPPNFQGPAGPRPKFPYPQDGRFSAPARPQPPNTERGRGRDHGPERDGDREDDIMPRPIIKEEDLNRMDDIGRDAGWAIHDDIDYNQKLTFSDDDTTTGDDKSKDKKDGRDPRGGREDRDRDRPIDRDRDRDRDREPDKLDRDDRPRNRAVEDEELWREQRRKQNEQMAAIVERAKQRKEEEEKRFEERQAKAKLKLGDLESKVKDENTTSLTTSPAIAEPGDEKPLPREAAEFRQLTQIERPTFLRERERERDRDRDMRGERMSGHGEAGPQFSRQFQNNLPPRFQKQQAERHAPAAPNSNQSFDQRWALPTTNNPVVYQPGKGHGPAGRRNRSEGESPNDRDREPLDDRPPSRDPRGERDRRERHTPDANDRDRDDTDPRDPRHRETWDRYDERRDPKKDYKPHAAGPDDFEDRDRERDRDRDLNRQDSGEWRDKDRDKLDRRDHRDSRERDIRDLRDLRDRDVRDPRDARDGRDVRDVRDTRDVRDPRDVRDVRDVRDPRDGRDARDTRDARDRDVREGRLARDFRDRDPREARESRDPRDRDLRDIRSDRDRDIIRDRDGPREVRDTLRDVRDRDVRDRDRDVRDIRRDPRDDRDIRDRDVRDGGARELRDVRDVRERERERDPRERDPEPRETRERGPRDRREIRGPRDVDARDLRDLRDDRPQRPDSRDSRASRESRNSRDSTREDLKLDGPSPGREFSGSWADATFDPHYESKEKKHRDFYRDRRDAADKSERKTSVETVEAWRSLPTSDLPQAEKDAPGSKAWADQLPPIDQSPSPEPVVKISEELPVADKPKAVLGPLLKEIEELTKIIDDKVVIDDVHREPRSDEDKIREDEKMDEGKPKSGRSRSGRGGRTADQARGGARQESGKDETRLAEGGGGRKRDRRGPRSPKSGGRKDEKDQDKPKDKDKDRPSDGGRRHDGASRGAPNDGSARDAPKDSSKEGSGREGFAPRGEPSRRGRGSLARGALGRRMDGYGPPSSKSPFGQVTSQQDKMNDGDAADPSVPNSISDGDGDKKTPSLSAGIIGSGLRTSGGPPGMSTGPGKPGSGPPGSQGPPRMNRKADGERKESRRRDGRQSTRMNKQNSVDGTEEWDSVSEGSEIDSQDVRNGGAGAGRRGFRQHPVGGSANQVQSGGGSGGRSGSGRRGGGGGGSGGSSGGNSGPGGRGEKRRDGNGGSGASQPSGNGIERRSGSGAPQTNGRGSGSRSGPPGGKPSQGTVAVNRVDEVKLNDPALVSQAISDLVKKDKEKEKTNSLEGIDLNNYASVVVVDDHPEVAVQEDTSLFDADNGFQEVRNKKTSKDMKKEEASNKGGRGKAQAQPAPSSQQPGGQLAPGQPLSGQMQTASGQGAALGQQSIQQGQQPPPLMGINTQPSGKQGFERSRSCKLPPRLAKQRENNRLQKQQAAAAQQHDVSEMNKMNQNISMYPMKDPSGPAPPPAVNAWEKPINASLRPNSPASNLSSSLQLSATITDNCIDANDHGPGSGGSSQRSSPAVDKLSREVREAREARDARDPRDPAAKDTVLDGASPPVQTIIFENTNFKQGPAATNKFPNHHKVGRIDKGRETEDSTAHQTHVSHSQHHSHGHLGLENITFPTAKTAEDGDMKLDFSFECADLQMDEKAKNMGLPRSMHSNISPSTADLNFKIASVKKVWESMPTVMEQGHGDDSQGYAPTFNSEGGLDPAAFGKAVDSPQMQMDEASEVVYSPGPPMQPNQNSYVTSVVSGVSSVAGVSAVPGMMKADPNSASPNVCKVKPQPSAVMPPGPGAGQLSPPPFNSQPASHIANFQPTMSSTAAQFGGISAIPSPPTVLYNSSQGGLYQTFLGDAQVLGGQPLGGQPLGGQPLGGQALGGQPLGGQPLGGQPLGGQPRSQFTQFTPYQLSQGLNQTSAFNQQSVYVHQSAPPPPHPPPSAAPDLYQPMSQYRLQPAAGPFGQSQQLSSNPNTVLISSSSNSLMSASVKPTSHSGQIGAIGTKGAAPGPYQAPAPQPSQLYIPYDPNQVLGVNQNFLSNSQLVQRAAPVQNMQPSSSFYSTNAGTQAGFYQAGSSLQAAPAAPQLHQTPTPFGLQSFSSHSPFLSSNLQIAAAVQQQQQQQQYRNPQTSYLKGGLGQQAQPPPPSSPSSQQPEMLTSVFSAVPQIPSPKSRDSKRSQGQQSQSGQVGPGGQNQQSPTSQHQVDQRSGSGGPPGQQSGPQGHKFSSYQGMPQSSHMLQQNVRGNQMNMGSRGMGQSAPSRYPTPIQRPVPYSQGGMPSGNMNMNRHRTPAHNTSRPPPSMGKQGYYGSSQGGSLKMDGASSVDTKPETNNAEHKDSTPASGSVDGSAPAEAVKDDAAPPSTE